MLSPKFQDLTVVIPTLNEAEAIGMVIDEVLGVGVPRENILVVDGGSTDGTVDIVKSKGIKVVIQEGKGKADAIRTVSKRIKTPYTLFMDGDYTYPAYYLSELYKKIKQGYSLVIGWRQFNSRSQPWIYRFGNKLLTLFFNLLFGTRLHDVLSGMYIVKTAILRELMYEAKSFGIESEIVAHVTNTTGDVAEIPIQYRQRLGRKKLGVKHGFQILSEMIKLAWQYNPTFLIFALGALLLIPGLMLGAYVAYYYFFTGIKYYLKGLVAMILTLTGLQSLLLAILALYLKRFELRLQRIIKSRGITVKT